MESKFYFSVSVFQLFIEKAYGNWPSQGTQWVEYSWPVEIATKVIAVYWFDDRRGVRVPAAARLFYWNGAAFVEVPSEARLGLETDTYNVLTFDEIRTTKLRVEMDGASPIVREIAAMDPIGIYWHGSNTDRMWKEGRIGELQDYLKAMRDTGKLVGVACWL